MIEIVASMSLPEYREVCRAITPRSRRRISRTGLRALTIACLGLCFFFTMLSPIRPVSKLQLVLLPYALLFACKLCLRYAIDSSYKRQQNLLQRQTMRIDETGIAGNWQDGTMGYRYAWPAFEACLELPSGMVYLLPAAGFVRIPTATLSPDDQAQIGAWSAAVAHIRS